jgi:hypothetical protein
VDTLHDLIYLDFEKAASIYSQMAGGLVTETQAEVARETGRKGGIGAGVAAFRLDFGGEASDRTSQVESRILHHDLFQRIQGGLFEAGAACDLNAEFSEGGGADVTQIRERASSASFIRVRGRAVFEDFARVEEFAERFPDLHAFLTRCGTAGLDAIPEVGERRGAIAERRRKAEHVPNAKQRSAQLRKVEQEEEAFEAELASIAGMEAPPEKWLLDGIKTFITTFFPRRLILRLHPFPHLPDFHIMANLKRDCFLDGDLENVLFAYGSRPNLPLSVFGLVSSVPSGSDDLHSDAPIGGAISNQAEPETAQAPDQLQDEAQAVGAGEPSSEAAFEAGFRGLFDAMEGFERFVRFSRYPNLTVYPVAVFRTIRLDRSPSP